MSASELEPIYCRSNPPIHLVDRRKLIQETKRGPKVENFTCACGFGGTNAGDFRGGRFEFVYSDDDAKRYDAFNRAD